MYLEENGKIWLAKSGERVYLEPSMANRHGLIAGATGTGKTVTLKVIAESFSEMGVPVFISDVKGDVSGMMNAGAENKHIRRSIDSFPIENFSYTAYPVRFFDVYGKKGLPVRATVSDMGPELLARLLGLNEIQTGVLRILFRIADEKGLLLLDLKDLRSMAQFAGENANEFKLKYGNISAQSVGAIQRALLALEDEGGGVFFGEPMLQLADWLDWDDEGRGMMNILESSELFQHPLLYGTFLLWMLSELYELLPEAGDLDRPKVAFFFDEAHLMFHDAPKALVEKIEQVVRLIRSKGVSVWFITQNPTDLPESVLSQIANRVQHALRAYTPNEQKALRYAARSFRSNPDFDTERTLQELATGEALVSVLDEKGVPGVVQKAAIMPPRSSMAAAPEGAIEEAVKRDPLYGKYFEAIDRESAYELLSAMREEAEKERAEAEEEAAKAKEEAAKAKEKEKEAKAKAAAKKTSSKKKSALSKATSSAANTFGRELGKSLFRGLLGVLKR